MRIITRETTFTQMSDKERELLAKGFHSHIGRYADIEDLEVKDMYDLLTKADAKVIFYRDNGKDQFKLQINQKRFIADFIQKRLYTPLN